MMHRRVPSLVLIVQLLLTQPAHCHCHSGSPEGSSDVASVPHIHTDSLPLGGGCRHHHGHAHHHKKQPRDTRAVDPDPCQDHDSDAVPVPDSLAADRSWRLAPHLQGFGPAVVFLPYSFTSDREPIGRQRHPPSSPGAPVWLRTLKLLI